MPSSGATPQQKPRTPWEKVGSGSSSMGTKAPFATDPTTSGKTAGAGAGAGSAVFLGASASMTSGGTANIQVRLKAVANTAAASATYMMSWLGE